ncbi:MAG: response regulator [Elainellaceae cyanobacterium]
MQNLVMQGSHHRSQLKILLVEDNLINQKVLLKQLGLLGYAVDAVGNGQDAIDAIAHSGYDIVLMDCQMPILDGYKATEAIRQRHCRSSSFPDRLIVIIALTANAMIEDYDRAIASGMNDYLSKPVLQTLLAETLDYWGNNLLQPGSEEVTDTTDESLLAFSEYPQLSSHIDWDYLNVMTDGSTEFGLELLKLFVHDNLRRLDMLKQSLADQNTCQVEQIAHYIKGSSASVGARLIQAAASQLEAIARQDQLLDCDLLLCDIENSLHHIQVWMIATTPAPI